MQCLVRDSVSAWYMDRLFVHYAYCHIVCCWRKCTANNNVEGLAAAPQRRHRSDLCCRGEPKKDLKFARIRYVLIFFFFL
jgi:hypothetical protein